MRIVYLTDVHGATKSVETLLRLTEADLYIVAGDLVNRPFRLYKDFFRFIELEQRLSHLKCRGRTEVRTISFARNALANGDCDERDRPILEEYLKLHERAERNIRRSLDALAGVFATFPHKTVFALPGNYDMDFGGTDLAPFNLHKSAVTVSGLKLAGYGGANVRTPGVPEDLSVAFNEISANGILRSEPRDFLSEAAPHVAVTHVPPYGFFDALPHGNVGSVGIRDYMDQMAPKILLCGHVHENWGVVIHGETVIVNPSNFGKVADIRGTKKGGFFFDFITEGTHFKVGTLRYLEREKIKDVKDYVFENGALRELTIDRGGLARLTKKKNRDDDVLQEIRDFKRVRNFFREYETPESRKRMQDLRSIYRKLAKSGQEIAFEILGSVNFGMSESGSDVDLVMYRRCACKTPLPETQCTLPRTLFQLFKMLEERYSVEVLDCVNLNRVEASIREVDDECPALQRFVLYRAIGRPVNLRMIRETESLLDVNPELKRRVEHRLREYIHVTVTSQSHIYSFQKYKVRLTEQGIDFPPHIVSRLRSYLRAG